MEQENERTVLIIDDSEDDIFITVRVLSRLSSGIQAVSSASGEEGLERLRACGPLPAVVLLDLKMRGMDGIEVLRHMRADARLSPIPVFILTHSALDADLEAAREAGATGVLRKTVSIAQFQEELRQALQPWLQPAS